MPGSLDLFDSVNLTSSSEYDSRNGERIQYLQIHHATMTSLSGLRAQMDPGGRTVSANGALGNDGHLMEVVPLSQRAFTSATGFDRRCLTVESCNTTLAPNWGISNATRTRLANLAVKMFRAGILGSLTRAHIIQHSEVPGTYPTACAGPDMHMDLIVAEANAIYNGGGIPPAIKGDIMARYQWAPSRGGVLVKGETGGIYYPANQEEAEVLSTMYSGIDLSDRQWDVSRQASLNILNSKGESLAPVTQAIDTAFAAIATLIKEGQVDPKNINVDELAAKLAPLLAKSGVEAKVDAKALAEVFLNASVERMAS